MNRIADPHSIVLDRTQLFLEEQVPYDLPGLDSEALTPTKRVLIAAIRLLPEIADEFEQGLNVKRAKATSSDLTITKAQVTLKTRLQRARERFPALVSLLTQGLKVTQDNPLVPSWASEQLVANARTMYSSTLVFTDRIRELGFEDVPLVWGLFPSAKFAGAGTADDLRPFRNHFLMVGACWNKAPVYDEGEYGDYDGDTMGPATDALLLAENAMTRLIWRALERAR